LIVLALTAFFLCPQAVEIGWVQIGLQVVKQDFHNYFLFAGAPDSSRYRQTWAGVNEIASLMTLAQTATAIALGFVCRRLLQRGHRSDKLTALVWLSLGLTAFGLFISLPLSEPLWRSLPGLKFIQFPWRFQPFVALACGLLAAAAVDQWRSSRRLERMVIAAALTWLIVVNGLFTFVLSRLNEHNVSRQTVAELLGPNDLKPIAAKEEERLYNEDELKIISYIANQSSYRPEGADSNLYPPAREPGGLSFVTGRGRITSQQLQISRRQFEVDNEQPVRIRIDTYHYPHWVARLDGKEIKLDVEGGESANQGLILLDLPAGTHRLTLDFEIRNNIERLARLVSIAAWLLFIAWMIGKNFFLKGKWIREVHK
jgi:hypothetical protein